MTSPVTNSRWTALLSSIRQLGRILLIVALLLSGGTHWFALQSIAWTTMIVARARETSVVDAVKQTFDGAHPCSLCEKIGKGRETEKQHDGPVLTAKIELFYESARVVLHPPQPAVWTIGPLLAIYARTQVPALPPPRLG